MDRFSTFPVAGRTVGTVVKASRERPEGGACRVGRIGSLLGSRSRIRTRGWLCLAWAAPVLAGLAVATPAHALVITPVFDSSVTGNGNAAAIEGAIDSALGTIDGLYANPVSISVDFTYTAAADGNLLSTAQNFYAVSYGTYVNALSLDASANPQNTVLATALAHLSQGNDASGANELAITGAQAAMLGLGPSLLSNATININSNQNFAFARPVSSGQYDLIGGLEHELDEVLGGGGAGSTLNSIAGSCGTDPTGFFCSKYGALDLYRYSSADTPSFTTSPGATAYFSVDGGTTSIVGFNQNSAGDYADFSPAGTGAGQLIQNAFNSTGQDEPYTTNSPEFLMQEAIGWDAVPEPSSLALLLSSVIGMLGLYERRKRPRTS